MAKKKKIYVMTTRYLLSVDTTTHVEASSDLELAKIEKSVKKDISFQDILNAVGSDFLDESMMEIQGAEVSFELDKESN